MASPILAGFTLAWLAGFAAPAGALQLRSTDLAAGGTLPAAQVYAADGCSGANRSPALSWTDAPAGTRSFAVTLSDPDAPSGTWWHWVMFDLRADAHALPRGAGAPGRQPAGASQTLNDFGTRGYGGACPPAGDPPHRYVFTVHALKVDHLKVPPDATAAQAASLIEANRIDSASITVRYGR
jgi:Raf kinase inhibitor-like YbhB/YbcL family protein